MWDTTVPTVDAGALPGVKNSIFKHHGEVKDANPLLRVMWSKVSGLGEVSFGTPNSVVTTVKADVDGPYTIRLTAVDAAGNENSDEVSFVWDTTPPRIAHSPVRLMSLDENVGIEMGATDNSAVSGELYYRPGGNREFRAVLMTEIGDVLVAEIPTTEISYGFAYYLEARDAAGNSSQFPKGAIERPLGVAVSGTYTHRFDFLSQSWNLFSVPLSLMQADLKVLLDDVSGRDNWVTNIWNGTESVQMSEPVTVLGAPLWLISKSTFKLQVDGDTVDPSQHKALSLSRGWNLVANPYLFPVPFGNISVLSVNEELISLTDPRMSGIVRAKFWRWQDTTPNDVTDGQYEVITNPSQHWEPWSGYWMFAVQATELQIAPFTEFASSAPTIFSTPEFDWLGTLAIGNTREVVRVQIALANGYHQDTNLLDVEQPPLPTDVSLSLTKNQLRFQRLSLSSQADELCWNADMYASDGVKITLSDALPVGHHLYMEDALTGLRKKLIPNVPVPVLRGKHHVQFRLTKQKLGPALEGAVPITTSLLPNYPNPFNPETWIPYQVASDGDIKIWICDANGMLVRRIDLGYQEAGYYVEKEDAAYWDGRSEIGERVSSGLYFYCLKSDEFSSVRRMTILK